MDFKKLIKNITIKDVAIVLLVPTVVSVGYYGYKAYKKHKDEKEEESNKEGLEKTGGVDGEEIRSEEVETKEVKIIPITRGAIDKNKEETKKIKGA